MTLLSSESFKSVVLSNKIFVSKVFAKVVMSNTNLTWIANQIMRLNSYQYLEDMLLDQLLQN